MAKRRKPAPPAADRKPPSKLKQKPATNGGPPRRPPGNARGVARGAARGAARAAASRPRPARGSPLERAQKLAWKAFETFDVERRLTLAEEALALSSDCADAYTIISQFADD